MSAESFLFVRCPKCNSINQTTYGHKGLSFKKQWIEPKCDKCHELIPFEQSSIVTCPSCGELVVRDSSDICPKCGKDVGPRREIKCPKCGNLNVVSADTRGTITCQWCKETIETAGIGSEPECVKTLNLFSAQYLSEKKSLMEKIPGKDCVAQTRLVVSPGTGAALVYGGTTLASLKPGAALLGDILANALGRSVTDEDCRLTSFYIVRDQFPTIRVGTAEPVRLADDEGRECCEVRANAEFVFEMADAKLFADYAGYADSLPDQVCEVSGTLWKDTRDEFGSVLSACIEEVSVEKGILPAKWIPMKGRNAAGDIALIKPGNAACMDLLREKISEAVTNRLVDFCGLRVLQTKLDVGGFEPESLKNRNTVRQYAEKSYALDPVGIEMRIPGEKLVGKWKLTATVRPRISDETAFFAASEIRSCQSEGVVNRVALEADIRNMLDRAFGANANPVAMQLADGFGIAVDELNMSVLKYQEMLKDAMTNSLAGNGLEAQEVALTLSGYQEAQMPAGYSRRKDRVAAAKLELHQKMSWTTQTVTVHVKGNRDYTSDVVFSGSCVLNVVDEGAFCRLPEAAAYIQDDRNDIGAISRHFSELIHGELGQMIASKVQGLIDSRDADILNLFSYSEVLSEYIKAGLNELIGESGVEMKSLTLNRPTATAGKAYQRYLDTADKKDQASADVEIAGIEADKDVKIAGINAGKKEGLNAAEERILRSDSGLADLKNEEEKKQLLRKDEVARTADQIAHEKQLRDIRGDAEVDAALDEKMDAATRRQNDRDELARAIARKVNMDDAKFKLTLQEILHEIDASDLEWQKKLDAYNRLQNQLSVEDTVSNALKQAQAQADTQVIAQKGQADITRLTGQAAEDVARMKDETSFLKGLNNIKLSTDQANLAEAIDKFAEERNSRVKQEDAQLKAQQQERDFAQKTQEKREELAFRMELLKLIYEKDSRDQEHEERLREKQNEIDKLRMQVDYFKERDIKQYETEQVKSFDASQTEMARANAQQKTAEAQINLNRAFINQAQELLKQSRDIDKEVALRQIDAQSKGIEKKLDDLTGKVEDAGAGQITGRLDALMGMLRGKPDVPDKPDAEKNAKGASKTDADATIEAFSKMVQRMEAKLSGIEKTLENPPAKCRVCGRILSDDWVACPYCGEQVRPQKKNADPFAPNTRGWV